MNDGKLEQNGMVPGENEITPNMDAPKPEYDHRENVLREVNKERQGMAEKLFASYGAAKAQTRKEIDATTGEGWHNYESRTLLLQKNAAHAPKTASLTDRVRGMFGRR